MAFAKTPTTCRGWDGLVEAKVRGTPGVLEQLDLYARLFPLSPDYQHLIGRTVVRDLVWAVADPVIESMARERGIRVHLFHPAWVDEYLETLRHRDRTPTLPGDTGCVSLALL